MNICVYSVHMKYDIRHTVLCLDSEDSKHFDLILTNTFCSDQSQISSGHAIKPQNHKLITYSCLLFIFICSIGLI